MPTIEELVAEMERSASREISPKDEMFLFPRDRLASEEATRTYYFDTGRALAVGVIRHVLDSGLDPSKLHLLDYAAGYGRVTRWFAPVFRRVTVADLEPEMIDFQARSHGVDGFVAPTDPQLLTVRRSRFDVVFVFSLFTHLPESSWKLWLSCLVQVLEPGGSLIFSVHSYELFALLDPARFGDPSTWTDDFVFWQQNETKGRLPGPSYGATIVKDSYVRSALASLPGLELVRHFRKGEFDRFHDIYIVRRI